MARIKHRPSTPDSGFRPIQLSRAEISRMQQESSRVIQNMERNRRSEMEQRQQILQTMKEDANYAKQQEAKNFEIQQKNLQTQALQTQLDAKTQAAQANINIKETEAIFGGLAKFSQSAAQVAATVQANQEKKKYENDTARAIAGLDEEKSLDYVNIERALTTTQQEEYASNLRQQEADGADPNAIARSRVASPAVTHMANKANANYMLKNQFPQVYENALNDPNLTFQYEGRTVTAAEARNNPRFARDLGQALLNKFIVDKNLRFEPRMLLPGLQAADNFIQTKAKAASQVETRNAYAISEEQAFNIALRNPEEFPANAVTVFRMWKDNPTLGNEGALNNWEKLATARNADNTGFVIPLEMIKQAVIKDGGKPFYLESPRRWSNIKQNRVEAEIKADKLALTIDNLAYNKDSTRILQGLTDDPTQANANKAVEFFRETYGKVPGEITKFQSSFTNEVIEKKEAADRYLAIPNGFLTREAVDAGSAIDIELGKELQRRYAAQEERYNSGIYKETSDAFKNTANGVTAYGTNKPNTAASVFLQSMVRAEYRKRVDQAVAGGADFNQAATTIGQQLDAEVKAGARDQNSIWYRKPDAPGGAATFPNLNKGMVSGVEAANRRYQDLKKNIATNGLERTINTKGSIITADEAQQIVRDYGKPGFTIPADVQAVAGMSNGLDPMVIINRQLTALGMKPLQPPPSMQTTQQLVSPAFQKLLYKTPSPARAARGLGSSNTFNASIVPNNYGPLIAQAAQANGVNPSHIAALAEIESNFNPNAPSYNNSSFGVMQINRDAHPAFFAQQNWKDPQANINYGTQYYAGLLRKYGDPVAAAMAYNAGPGNYDAYLRGEMPDGRKKTEMINHGKKFAAAMYKYGGGGEALNNPALMRSGSAVGVSTPARALNTFSPQVSSVTFDTGQPGIDVFFEDKQFPAVLPGIVKDVSFQGSDNSGYGNYIVIESTDPQTGEKVDVLYSHLAARPNLNPGQAIRTGQIIGQQGGTGRVRSADGTIASIDFLRPAGRGSKNMTPYRNYDQLRRRIASQLRSI